MALGPAHKGYMYQDVVTAYFFAKGLVQHIDSITVDSKTYPKDVFDDLTIRTGSRVVRRQFKYSSSVSRTLEEQDFTTERSSLRIDDVVRCHRFAKESPASEYRICVRWGTPTDEVFEQLLEPLDGEASFTPFLCKLFKLKANQIWPDGEAPRWKPLCEDSTISRQEFVDFTNSLILEVECPDMSCDLYEPGPLEKLLLSVLRDKIGIGRYPNDRLRLEDAAAQLIHRANVARIRSETLTPENVEAHLGLRTDYGRLPQQFPIEKEHLVERSDIQNELYKQVMSARWLILQGSPGSGKSWALTELAETLEEQDVLVARHYCYLEPGDPFIQQRIAVNAVFGDLMAELTDAAPALRENVRSFYAAGPEELIELLETAVKTSQYERIILIVDGLDHIARVHKESPQVAAADTNIVEEIGCLDFPEDVCVLFGSQPGEHLSLLSDKCSIIELPAWDQCEVSQLAARYKLPTVMKSANLEDLESDLETVIWERSEGNPLYATVLCKCVLSSITSGVAIDPIELVNGMPQGNISAYYDYLFRASDNFAKIIAKLLAYVDFAISTEDLGKIYPSLRTEIPKAVTYLSPVLKDIAGQGGIRIYHESFRRFIIEHYQSQGEDPADVLGAVIEWLSQKGFYDDSRAYRFLLPCLRRAGRQADILQILTSDFVVRSVGGGHPYSAVETNLLIALDVAAQELDWPAMARLIELYRSMYTCYEYNLSDMDLYGKAYLSLHGPRNLSERLLFEGRPTFSRQTGLVLCGLCDDNDIVPPWSEYLDLKRETGIGHDQPTQADIRAFQGLLRLNGLQSMLDKTCEWLNEDPEPDIPYFRGILRQLIGAGGPDVLDHILSHAKLSDGVRAVIKTELAIFHSELGNSKKATELATQATQWSQSPSLVFECLKLGASEDEASLKCPDLDDLTERITSVEYVGEDTPVSAWVSGVGIAATTNPEILGNIKKKVGGIGWYRGWLCFVLNISLAEVEYRREGATVEKRIVSALQELAGFDNPFEGSPRACDLYSIRNITNESFVRAIRLATTRESWIESINLLKRISGNTTTHLQGSPSGPMTDESLSKLLLEYVSSPLVGEQAIEMILAIAEETEQRAAFYEIQAEHEMRLVLALSKASRKREALQRWNIAAMCLTAYGFRKDRTIWEVMDGLPALASRYPDFVRSALASLQTNVASVVAHTDGRETQYAPNAWFEVLCQIDPTGAAVILAQSLVKEGGIIDWRLEDAVKGLLGIVKSSSDPLITSHLYVTVPFDGSVKDIENRLIILERLFSKRPDNAEKFLRTILAQVQGDSKAFSKMAFEKVNDFAQAHGLEIQELSGIVGEEEDQKDRADLDNRFPKEGKLDWLFDEPPFGQSASPLEVMARFRKDKRYVDTGNGMARLVNAFGYRLVTLMETGHTSDVSRLIHDFAREYRFSSRATPLADLALGLERHGYSEVASVAFVLAYLRSRGHRGWSAVGDSEHQPWFFRAVGLSEEIALRTLATGFADILTESIYTTGMVPQLVELFAGLHKEEIARNSWQSAYEVIQKRLFWSYAGTEPFVKYTLGSYQSLSLDQALVALLCARISHPELKRKLAAISGVASILSVNPECVIPAYQMLFAADTSFSSIVTLLQLLLESEPAPYPVTSQLRNKLELMSKCDSFALREVSKVILERAN
ncbi:MAG: ATP-binding protein [Planctomycetota bacterium]